jgi:hypothetical protein
MIMKSLLAVCVSLLLVSLVLGVDPPICKEYLTYAELPECKDDISKVKSVCPCGEKCQCPDCDGVDCLSKKKVKKTVETPREVVYSSTPIYHVPSLQQQTLYTYPGWGAVQMTAPPIRYSSTPMYAPSFGGVRCGPGG